MKNNWLEVTVDDIKADLPNALATGPFGSSISSRFFQDNGVPVIRGSNLSENVGERLNNDGLVFLSQDKADEFKRSVAKRGDLIFTCWGTIGQVGLIDEKSPFDEYIVSNKQMKLTPNTKKADSLFLYYLFSSPEISSQIKQQSIGSSVPGFNLGQLRSIQFSLPSLPEQRAIAGMLGALDDKIELNRRMNRTLESLARAVFRELMKEESGKETTIGEVVTVVGGSTPSTKNPAFWDGGEFHWSTPKDLSALQDPILLDTNSRITELGLQEISSGLLPVGTVLLSSRAPIGYLAITQIPVAINQGFIAIKCTDEVPNYFILNWLKDSMEEIIGRANGTTFLEISKSNFRPMPIFIPSPEKMKEFVNTVEPMYQKIVANLKESRTLASLRDSLLPKLMRGEVRVAVHE
ncbi:MAG: restriction endonuclease subunit S [Anaerolineales bacterium]|nr:restriction endonuclease subunit S [Anaerolineales bacterium]